MTRLAAFAAVILIVSGCGERRAHEASQMPATTSAVSDVRDPCADAATDPCGVHFGFWLEELGYFEEGLDDAISAMGPNVSPRTILEEADETDPVDDPLAATDVLEACSSTLRRLGRPPGGPIRQRRDVARVDAYIAACPKFEAAAAVFGKGLAANDRALVTTGQELLAEGVRELCSAGIFRPADCR
jgi:hypothetical protein